jgi:hypothetical protein
VVLGGLADNGANACSRCASNQASFEASTEYGAEDCTARASDGRAFAGADATLVLVEAIVIAVVSMARIVILSAVSALADALAEVAVGMPTPVIALLCQTGHGCDQESGGEESFWAWHSNSLSSAARHTSRGND